MEDNSIWRSCINTKYDTQFLTLEEAMELIFGSLLQKRLINLRKIVFLNWGTVGKSDFGKIIGVEDNLYVRLSLTYIAWPILKRQRLLRFG